MPVPLTPRPDAPPWSWFGAGPNVAADPVPTGSAKAAGSRCNAAFPPLSRQPPESIGGTFNPYRFALIGTLE
jgi:hypothetical protein